MFADSMPLLPEELEFPDSDELDFPVLEELDFAFSDELDTFVAELDDLASLLEDVTLEEDFASLLLEVVVLEELLSAAELDDLMTDEELATTEEELVGGTLEELMAIMFKLFRTGCASLPIFWIQHLPSMTLSV